MKKFVTVGKKIVQGAGEAKRRILTHKSEGIDGILVVVGLCIVALLLIVVMKDQLADFVTTLFGNMTTKAQGILGI